MCLLNCIRHHHSSKQISTIPCNLNQIEFLNKDKYSATSSSNHTHTREGRVVSNSTEQARQGAWNRGQGHY